MKQVTKLSIVLMFLLLTVLGSVAVAYAADAHDRPGDGRPGGHGGHHRGSRIAGVITEVTSDSVTISRTYGLQHDHPISGSHPITNHHGITGNRAVTIVVNLSTTTVVHLVECQCDGSLSDLSVADHVHVKASKDAEGVVTAKEITIAPNGERLGGAVTAITGETLTIAKRDGATHTIVTNGDTKFFTRDGAVTLADVAVGSKVAAYGATQADGSLLAMVVLIRGAQPAGASATTDAAAVDSLVDNLTIETQLETEIAALQLFIPLMRR